MSNPTADAGRRTPTQRNPPLETCLRVILLSFVAPTLLATPREGAAQPLPPSETRVIVGNGLGGQSRVRVFAGNTAAFLPGPLGSFAAFTQKPDHHSAPSAPYQNFRGGVRVAGCDLNDDGTGRDHRNNVV